MNLPQPDASSQVLTSSIPARFCWSKIGTESGETLDRILIRKEFERVANGGYFLWGVGNSVMNAIAGLFYIETRPRVIFSRMKSKPKAMDEHPSAVFAWFGAQAADGASYAMPPFSLITSRGDAAAERQRPHYALVCYSPTPLTGIVGQDALDAASLVNLLTGRPLGASQVTSVVRRSAQPHEVTLRRPYSVDFTAELASPGQVRLMEPVLLSGALTTALDESIRQQDYERWCALVREIRRFKPWRKQY